MGADFFPEPKDSWSPLSYDANRERKRLACGILWVSSGGSEGTPSSEGMCLPKVSIRTMCLKLETGHCMHLLSLAAFTCSDSRRSKLRSAGVEAQKITSQPTRCMQGRGSPNQVLEPRSSFHANILSAGQVASAVAKMLHDLRRLKARLGGQFCSDPLPHLPGTKLRSCTTTKICRTRTTQLAFTEPDGH